MPFVSEKQRRFMYAKHPDIARRWEDEADAAGVSAVQPTGSGGRGVMHLMKKRKAKKPQGGMR